MFVVSFNYVCFFARTLKSNNIPFEVMSINLSFIFDDPITCQRV